jgi:hypothetical protein
LGRDGDDEEVIWVKSEPKYFREGGWTCDSVICPSANQPMVGLIQAGATRHVEPVAQLPSQAESHRQVVLRPAMVLQNVLV